MFIVNNNIMDNLLQDGFYGIPGVTFDDACELLVYKGQTIDPDAFFNDLEATYLDKYPQDKELRDFEDWCWDNPEAVQKMLDSYVTPIGKTENHKRNVKMKYMYESEDDARNALARELGVSRGGVRLLETDDYDHYEPDYAFEVRTKDGSMAIYLVYDNEEFATTSAADDLGEHFRDAPEILAAAIDYFGFPTFAEYINGVDEDELADIEQLNDELSKEEFANYVVNNLGVDYRGFAELNINELGPAWHLAEYDGKELELPNGMVAYRVE